MTLQEVYDNLQVQAIAESMGGKSPSKTTLVQLGQAAYDLHRVQTRSPSVVARREIVERTIYCVDGAIFPTREDAEYYIDVLAHEG